MTRTTAARLALLLALVTTTPWAGRVTPLAARAPAWPAARSASLASGENDRRQTRDDREAARDRSGRAALSVAAADINEGWRFHREDQPGDPAATGAPQEPEWDASAWEPVTLPHTARIESPRHGANYFQGVCWYRRTIEVRPEWLGRRVTLTFDGAMQTADVWVNGHHVIRHTGGYLPFSVDLTSHLPGQRALVVAVRLDNRADPDVPPGSSRIDFAYYGGLYRKVRLIVTDPVHITDPLTANRVAGGGVFVRYEGVTRESAVVVAQAHVKNDGQVASEVTVTNTLYDVSGRRVAASSTPAALLDAGHDVHLVSRLEVAKPLLWHPDHPHLYRLVTTVARDGTQVDQVDTRCGIRQLAYTDEGFFINGERLVIRGANRHMSFPWIGNAASDNLQYRDLRLLKEAGFNFVRLAHYPQSPATMDAADELGLLVLVCTPGWQYFKDSPSFRAAAERDVREMVRWHRNHASAVLWEVSLNETYGHDAFYAAQSAAAHEEYPGGQLFTSGDSHRSQSVRHYDVTYPEWGGFYQRPLNPDSRIRRGLVREYGDYEFGGQESTTRVSRGAGEDRLLLQAWNFQWSHNQDLSWPWVLGDAIWAGIDNASSFDQFKSDGSGTGSWWGPLDITRLPKPSYFFFQSQRSPDVVFLHVGSGPMVHIASGWTPRTSPTRVIVFSNADEVELRVNGRRVARQRPDAGPDSPYDPSATADTESPRAANVFDGGNARHIDRPPFTFMGVPYEAGELKAVAYRQGAVVATDVRRTPGAPVAIRLRAPTLGRPLTAGCSDALFIYADIVDARGNVVPDSKTPVRFEVLGAARFVGPTEVAAEAGIAAALLQAGSMSAAVRVRATAPGLREGTLRIPIAARSR